MWTNETLPILIVEDSDEDFEMLIVAFKQFGLQNEVVRCEQGEEVIPCLQKMFNEEAKLPGLVLLDLNLIGMDGRSVLQEIKSHPIFKRMPTVVLSTSSSPKDVSFCYDEGANGYIVKPVDLEKFERFVQSIKLYWIDTTILPRISSVDLTRNNVRTEV